MHVFVKRDLPRLGAYLLPLVYQLDVLVCAMFLTGQAANPLIAGFALQVTGTEISYARWAVGAIVLVTVGLVDDHES